LFNEQFFIQLKQRGILSLLFSALLVLPAHALSDEEIKRGFNLTVFGSEIAPLGFQARYIRPCARKLKKAAQQMYLENVW